MSYSPTTSPREREVIWQVSATTKKCRKLLRKIYPTCCVCLLSFFFYFLKGTLSNASLKRVAVNGSICLGSTESALPSLLPLDLSVIGRMNPNDVSAEPRGGKKGGQGNKENKIGDFFF